jgi:Arc/MetJ-type ribon-helix-helix transcriptional regulator
MEPETENCSIITVYLYSWQVKWLKENGRNRSDFIREAVTEAIENEAGSERRVGKLRERKQQLLDEIEMIDIEIETAKVKEGERRHESLIAEIRGFVARKIKFGSSASINSIYMEVRERYGDADFIDDDELKEMIRVVVKEELGVNADIQVPD